MRPLTPPSSDGGSGAAAATGPALNSTTANGTTAPMAEAASGYRGRSLAGFAAWQAGNLIGRTMRWVGMGEA